MPSPKLDPLLCAAVHCRDGGRCIYCGRVIVGGDLEGVELSVDHVVPRVWWGERPGLNHPGNLMSCCDPCNSLKGTTDAERFAAMVDAHKANLAPEYAYMQSVTGADILARIQAARGKPINYALARAALAIIKANRES